MGSTKASPTQMLGPMMGFVTPLNYGYEFFARWMWGAKLISQPS